MEAHRTHFLPYAVSYVHSLKIYAKPHVWSSLSFSLEEEGRDLLKRCDVWEDNRLRSL